MWDMQIEALKAAGVNEVVLAINYQPEVKTEFTNQRNLCNFILCVPCSNDFL
jgi:NDP-sugar pyrophosphorylase family protein